MDLGIDGLGDATKIGVGATAVVYRAVQIPLDREVAIKVLNSSDDDFVRRFRREAKTLGRLSKSPGIVSIHDTGLNSDGKPYLLLELCDGSLLGRLDDGPMDPVEAGRILAKTGRALAAAHKFGIVHRDVKPANILHSSGRYLLTDFGIASAAGTTAELTDSVGFTAGYVAPEVVSGEPVGPAADVYGLGASLFHLVSGETAFLDESTNGNLLALVNRVLNDSVPDLRERGVPDRVCDVIEQAMHKSPDERPSADELADLLLGFGSSEPGESGTDPVAVSTAKTAEGETSDDEDAEDDDSVGGVAEHDASGKDVDQDDASENDRGADGTADDASDEAGPVEGVSDPLIPPRQRRRILETGGSGERNLIVALAAAALLGGLFGGLLWAFGGSDDGDAAQAVEAVDGGSANDDDGDGDAAGPAAQRLEPEGEPEEVRQALLSALGPDALGGPTSAVPNVIGQRAGTARSIVRDAGFRVATVEVDSQQPIGRVVRQSPQSGGSEPDGSLITIYVSAADAAPVTRVPAVIGDDGSAARAAIEGAGLVYTETTVFSVEPAGEVIAQEPEGSMQVNPGATVLVYISQGRPVVPNLIGVGTGDAEQRLADVGLLIESVSVVGPEPAGLIVSTQPSAGATADPGAVITVNVSDGTEVVPCPAPVGVGRSAAEASIVGGGCTVGSVTTQPSDTVADGDVIAATERSGMIVDLIVSSGPLVTSCPAVVGMPVDVARSTLEGADPACSVGSINVVFDTDVDENRFVRTADERDGRVVDLVVAAPGCLIPNVVGMAEADAASTIRNLLPPCRLQPVTNPVDGGGEPGTVVATSPSAGSVVDAMGTGTITLNVVREAAPLECQAVSTVGMTQAAARASLEAAGCSVTVSTTPVPVGDPGIGTVISESRSRLAVTIVVGVEEQPPTTPTTSPGVSVPPTTDDP